MTSVIYSWSFLRPYIHFAKLGRVANTDINVLSPLFVIFLSLYTKVVTKCRNPRVNFLNNLIADPKSLVFSWNNKARILYLVLSSPIGYIHNWWTYLSKAIVLEQCNVRQCWAPYKWLIERCSSMQTATTTRYILLYTDRVVTSRQFGLNQLLTLKYDDLWTSLTDKTTMN